MRVRPKKIKGELNLKGVVSQKPSRNLAKPEILMWLEAKGDGKTDFLFC